MVGIVTVAHHLQNQAHRLLLVHLRRFVGAHEGEVLLARVVPCILLPDAKTLALRMALFLGTEVGFLLRIRIDN